MTAQSDPEIVAMMRVLEEVSKLDTEQTVRVLRWVADRCGVAGMAALSIGPADRAGQTEGVGTTPSNEFTDLADFFYAANPQTDSERALVVAYWLQVAEGESGLDAQRMNTQLKQLGHGITNITTALTDLINKKPRLVIQTHKSGSTQQARKRYRVTAEGVRRVRDMVSGHQAG
jgi:hypothetical protein